MTDTLLTRLRRGAFQAYAYSYPHKQAYRALQPRSRAEWVSLAIASAILLGVIGIVIFLWTSDDQRQPPVLEVHSPMTRQQNGQFYVDFEVVNLGGRTAEFVQVVATLSIGGQEVESGEQTLDFLSSQEQVTGSFVFSHNPQKGDLRIRVASYQDP